MMFENLWLANNIRERIADEVKLEVPDSKTSNIRVSKEGNDLVFQSGWETFASAYELEQGDILLFEYSGSSRFDVRIFDQSCCEKELSCVTMNNTSCVNERDMSQDNHMQSPRNESEVTSTKLFSVYKRKGDCTGGNYVPVYLEGDGISNQNLKNHDLVVKSTYDYGMFMALG
ncbi:hypothetical protein VPH35_096044 [Triticum aestivum]|uniref:B3 domain-containing protein n=1 Tax=Aegilops tauschii TaxID=37682 RepID=M8BR77_AEGTA